MAGLYKYNVYINSLQASLVIGDISLIPVVLG
jgi:hypothetical protein